VFSLEGQTEKRHCLCVCLGFVHITGFSSNLDIPKTDDSCGFWYYLVPKTKLSEICGTKNSRKKKNP